MKKQSVILTESGATLIEPDDGFVLYGSLLKGDDKGGLLGDSRMIGCLVEEGFEGRAYTNFELLDALDLDLTVLNEYIERRTTKPRIHIYYSKME